MKPPKAGADDFIASGHAEADLADLPGTAAIGEAACSMEGDDFLFVWPECDVRIEVTTIKEHSEGVTAELAVSLAGRELHWGRLALASTPARGQLVKRLAQQHRALPWGTIVEHACREAVKAIRRPEPPVLLEARPTVGPRCLVEPFLPLHETTVFFGDGGAGKGYLALLLAAAVARGLPLPGGYGASARVPILYLDWETTREAIEDRCYRLGQGLGVSLAGCLYYRRMVRPFADELPSIRADVSRLGIGLLIADSLGPACGFEADGTGAAIVAMNALRACGSVTRLGLAHVSKAMADLRTPARPFGSVFIQNLARSAWEVRGAQEDAALTVALYDRKENDAPKRRDPIAFRLAFEPGVVRVTPGDLADAPDLRHGAPLAFQITNALGGGPKTTAQLAEDLEKPPETIGRTCRRLVKADKVIRVDDEGGVGRGHEVAWALKADR